MLIRFLLTGSLLFLLSFCASQPENKKSVGTSVKNNTKNNLQELDEDFDSDQEVNSLEEEDIIADGETDNKKGKEKNKEIKESQRDNEILSSEPVVNETSGENKITDLKYLSGEDSGTVVIETEIEPVYQVRNEKERNQVVIEIANTSVPEKFKRPYITKEFGGDIGAINAYQKQGSSTARIVVQMIHQTQPKIFKKDRKILITTNENFNISQSVEDEELKKDEPLGYKTLDDFLTGQTRFYGKKLSIQVKDASVADVINFIAEQSGANLILTEEINAKVSLKLREIPWDQALVIVMRSYNLGYIRQGNVIRIASLEAIRKETEEAQKIVDSQKKIEKLLVKIVHLSYTPVKEMIEQVKPLITQGRGSVTSDERSAALIITDVVENIERITKLIKLLDIPPLQVLIEGKVVEAQDNFEKQVGINWSNSGFKLDLSSDGATALTSSINVGPSTLVTDGLDFSLNVGTLDILGDFSARLALSEKRGNIKLISSPRVVVINNEKASISQTTEVPLLQSQTQPDGTVVKNVSFKPAKLQLDVSPQITPDGGVILDIEVLREFLGEIVDDATRARALNARKAKTKVLVRDAQTAVIGGIYQSDATSGDTSVPWFSKIPIIGRLFKNENETKIKNELLIFLTPRIINSSKDSI